MSSEQGRPKGPLTDCSGSAGNSTLILAASSWRKFLIIQNIDAAETMWVNFGAPATAGPGSFRVPAGGTLTFDEAFLVTDAVYVFAGGSVPYTCKWSGG